MITSNEYSISMADLNLRLEYYFPLVSLGDSPMRDKFMIL